LQKINFLTERFIQGLYLIFNETTSTDS
jgi:hypothetical protein